MSTTTTTTTTTTKTQVTFTAPHTISTTATPLSIPGDALGQKKKRKSLIKGLSKIEDPNERMFKLMGLLYKPHPWHGLTLGDKSPSVVTAYVECVPGEGVKYEVDKPTGFLKVDRPHKYSSLCPAIYGFLPQTYCDTQVAARCMERTNLKNIVGDQDPLDICVLTAWSVTHGDLILECRPIGGFRMIDGGEADDKIIAVIVGDPVMSHWNDISDVPKPQLDLLLHYFLTYKQSPDSVAEKKSETQPSVSIPKVYGREEAYKTIQLSQADYQAKYSQLKNEFAKSIMFSLRQGLAQALLPQTDR